MQQLTRLKMALLGSLAFSAAAFGQSEFTNVIYEYEIDTQAEALALRNASDLIAASVTASTTQTQGQGSQTAELVHVDTVANDYDTVTAFEVYAGSRQYFFNEDSSEVLQIFPASGDDIGEGSNQPIYVQPQSFAVIRGKAENVGISQVALDTVYDATYSTTATFSERSMFGGAVILTGTATYSLPAGQTGMAVYGNVVGAVTATIDPNGSEVIVLNGDTKSGGVSIVSNGESGASFYAYWDSTGSRWIVQAVQFSEGS